MMPRVIAVCSLLFSSAPVWAQTFTLDQLIDKALQTDPRISEREKLVSAAEAMKKEALAHKDIQINANTFLGIAPSVNGGFFETDECDPSVSQCKVRDDRFDLLDGLSLWAYADFNLIKPLYTFGKVANYAEAARHNIEVKQSDVRLQRGSTIMDVKRAYYGHLASTSTVLFLEDVKRRIENAETMVQGWLDEGESGAKQSDLYAIQSAKELVDAYIHQAKGLQKISLDGMKVLSGLGLDNDLALDARGIRPLPLPEGDIKSFEQRALDKRPEMRQVESGLSARRALVEASKAMTKPNLYMGLAGVYSVAPGRDRLDNPYIYDPFNDYGMTPVVGLQWQWEPGVQAARTEKEQAELNALIEKKSFARQGIPFQVAESYNDVHAYYESVQSLERGARSARRWMISSYTDFEAGLERTDKIVTAFQGYVLAYTEYLKTVFEYNMRVAQLDLVTGAYE